MTRFRRTPGWHEHIARAIDEKLLDPIADDVAADANRNAPVDTGALSHSYYVTDVGGHKRQVGSDLDYAAVVELGSSPHIIELKNSSVLTDGDGEFFGPRVMHPGTKPQPHLRPALWKRRSL